MISRPCRDSQATIFDQSSVKPSDHESRFTLFSKIACNDDIDRFNHDCFVSGEFFSQYSKPKISALDALQAFKVVYLQHFNVGQGVSKSRGYQMLVKRPPTIVTSANINEETDVGQNVGVTVTKSLIDDRKTSLTSNQASVKSNETNSVQIDQQVYLKDPFNHHYVPETQAKCEQPEVLKARRNEIDRQTCHKSDISFRSAIENPGEQPRGPALDSATNWSTGSLGFWMVENNELIVPLNRKLDFTEKVYFSNLLNLRHQHRIIDPHLEQSEFIAEINSNLGYPTERRCDEEFRWVFKRVIKHLLRKFTEYQPVKSYRRDKYMGQISQRFFSNNPNMAEDLLSSNFASRKKVKMLFEQSATFKEEFLWYVNNRLESEYRSELTRKYETLFDTVIAELGKSPQVKTENILRQFRKRLDWTVADATDAKNLVNEMVDPYIA